MTVKHPAIGTCPCPIPKCGESCEVKKFARRHAKDTGRRFAGRWFIVCPKHGRLGMDGREAMQEYIGDHARMFGAAEHEPQPAATPAVEKPEAAPAPAATPARPAPRKSEWDFT